MFLTLLIAAQASLVSEASHPAVKIITLLQKLSVQVKEEGDAETNSYGQFTYWCQETIKEHDGIMKKSAEEITVATASLEALTADIESLNDQIDKLTLEITHKESQAENAATLRESGNTLFVKNKQDLEDTISAVDAAMTAIKDSKPALIQQQAMEKVYSLLEITNPKHSVQAGFLSKQKPGAEAASTEPAAETNADKFAGRTGRERKYDFKGGDIIEMLKGLKLNFEDDLVELNKAETGAVNADKLSTAARTDATEAATRAKDTKTEVVGSKGVEKANTQENLDASTATHTTAVADLDATKMTCRTHKDEYETRMKTRAGERAAMAQAVEVLEKITGTRTPESKGLTAVDVAFVQLSKKIEDPKKAIVNLLRKAGSSKGTHDLSKLADKIAALRQTPGSGVFDSIKNMIQKMIFHLMSEQKDEDDHKNWCDKENMTTQKMLDDKNDKHDDLDADMEDLKSKIAEFSEQIGANAERVSLLQGQIESETGIRNAEKAENAATMKDAQEAQTAISQAIAVLEDFYKSTGAMTSEPWEFVQKSAVVRRANAEPEPELWEGKDNEYSGNADGVGVIGLLTDIATNFASMESEARADETTQQSDHDEMLTTTNTEIAQAQKDSEMAESRKNRAEEKLETKTADFNHNNKELEATEQYTRDLQHACVDGDSTYADRKAARTQETEALRTAQGILEDAFKEDAAPADATTS